MRGNRGSGSLYLPEDQWAFSDEVRRGIGPGQPNRRGGGELPKQSGGHHRGRGGRFTPTSPIQLPAAATGYGSSGTSLSTSSSLPASELQRFAAKGEGMSEEKIGASAPAVSPMLYEHHFPIGYGNDGKPISSLSTVLLGLSDATLSQKRGIKLERGEKFCYCVGNKSKGGKNNEKKQKEKQIIFIYEAGVSPRYAGAIQKTRIYVKRKNEARLLVGFLTAEQSRVPLELILDEDCTLSHDSRRDVFFNGLLLSLSPKLVVNKDKDIPDRVVWRPKSVTFDAIAKKEMWVAEVHPSQELNFSPVDEGKEYRLLKAFSLNNPKENIKLHVRRNGKMELMGELVTGYNSIRFNNVFDDVFALSHTSDTTAVVFSGYTGPSQPFQFELKDLNEYTGQPEEQSLKASPKISLDPEYYCYQAKLATSPIAISKQPVVNLDMGTMSPMTAPLIFPRGYLDA